MKTANTKISSQQKTVLNEIRSLRKLQKTSENKTLILAKRNELRTRGTGSVDDSGIMVYFQSFSGTFIDGKKKGVVVYSKRADDNYWWEPVALFTWMTDETASAYFGEDVNDLYAGHCEFYESDWNSNDDSDNWPEFLDDESLQSALGITGAKGYFDGGDDVYVTPAEILHGQKIVIYYSNGGNNNVINSFSTEPKETSTLWVWIVLLVLFSLLLFMSSYPKK
jgi:hypothetical protein